MGRDADARGKAGIDSELGSILAGDQQPTLVHELPQVSQTVVTKPRTHIGGAIERAQVWRQLDFCQGNALFHVGMPLRISSAEAWPTGAKIMTSYLARRSSSFATVCVLM